LILACKSQEIAPQWNTTMRLWNEMLEAQRKNINLKVEMKEDLDLAVLKMKENSSYVNWEAEKFFYRKQ